MPSNLLGDYGMKSFAQKMLWLSLAVLIALPLAAEDKKKDKKKAGGEPAAVAQLKKQLANVDLKEEQKKKVEELCAEYAPKMREAAKAAGEAPKKVAEAKKRLKDEGKKGKEAAAALKSTANLTAEEQAAYDKLESLNQEFRTAVMGVLTEEQKEQAGLNKGKKKKKNA
jgi:hypothetical protein